MTAPTATEAARALAARRPRVTIICEVCGRECSRRPPARTCSNACRQNLHRQTIKRVSGADTPRPG